MLALDVGQVRKLLRLQDLIATLEKALIDLSHGDSGRTARRVLFEHAGASPRRSTQRSPRPRKPCSVPTWW